MATWGREIVRTRVQGYEVSILDPRPRSMLAVLAEAEKWGDREFVVFGRRRLSFRAFLDASAAAAGRLEARGIRKGDVVILHGANSPEWLLAFWALARIGAVVAQGNAWWTVKEMSEARETLGAKAILADRRRREDLRGHESGLILGLEELGDCFVRAPVAGTANSVPASENEAAVLIFTSGTTGRPKAAILSHRAVVACLHNIYHFRGKLPHEFQSGDPQLTLFCCNPLFHVGGLLLQCQALLSGYRLVLMDGRASGEAMLDVIEHEKVNIFMTVPTLLARAVEHPDIARRSLGSVVSFSASGSMVSPVLMGHARKAFPNARLGSGSTYGMTESGGSVTMITGEDYLAHPSSAGKAFAACEIRIANPDAEGVGEVLIKTPSAMSGYWGKDRDSIVDDQGSIHSGDLGSLDAQGYLHVTGRLKDIIIRGGENVSPSIIERRLLQHPAVREVAVVGLPHASLGEEVGAVVVLREGTSASAADLSAVVSGELAYFQVPTQWWVRTEPLPINAAGKIVKSQLRAEWSARATENACRS